MSDTMLLGVLRMPFDLAMSTLTSRIQYHRRGVQAADEIEQRTRERDEARAEIEKLRAENDEKQALIDAAREQPIPKEEEGGHAMTQSYTPRQIADGLLAGEFTRDSAFVPLAEVERLRNALTSIASNTCCGGCQEAARVARNALAGKP